MHGLVGGASDGDTEQEGQGGGKGQEPGGRLIEAKQHMFPK
jgi:hypothetical protein